MSVFPTIFKPYETKDHVYISCSPLYPQCLSQCAENDRFSIGLLNVLRMEDKLTSDGEDGPVE